MFVKPEGLNEEREMKILTNGKEVIASLSIPLEPKGTVIFIHGSGSSRFSPRNRFVAGQLQQENYATLLLDLLTADEESLDSQTRQLRFDINLLSSRVLQATEWLLNGSDLHYAAKEKIAFYGASTGTAAALVAASRLPGKISAIISRGGRPDLAGPILSKIEVPTLFLVGERDKDIIKLNKLALDDIRASEKEIYIVPGASHLFEEEGALEEVARLTVKWVKKYLV